MNRFSLTALLSLKPCAYVLTVAAVLLSLPSVSYAELLGQANGRLPTSGSGAPLSIELGYTLGNLSRADYDNKGLRVNYQFNPGIVIFADLGQTSVGSSSENSMGAGAFYNLGKIVSFSDNVALKGSVHTIKMNSLGTSASLSSNVTCTNGGTGLNPYTLELVIVPGTCGADPSITSGRSGSSSRLTAYSVEILMAGGLIEQLSLANTQAPSWYANTGVHFLSGSETDTEFSIGGGLVMPVSVGEAYVALDYISNVVFGLGFRYNIQ